MSNELGENWVQDEEAAAAAAPKAPPPKKAAKLTGNCVHCGVAMGNFLGTMTEDGPVHNDCVPAYRRLHVERCMHCDCVLPPGKRTILNGNKLHPECVADFKAKKQWVPPSKTGVLQKFAVGRSFFGSKNWKTRYFVLSKETGLTYYESLEKFQQNGGPRGKVSLDAKTRLITKPTRQIHKEALNPSKEFIIVFVEGSTELKLLAAASSWQEHDEWTKVLQCYIKIVDDPKDLAD